MSKNGKKALFISLFALDMALTVFLFVVSIIMIVKAPKTTADIDPKTFIGYFQANPTIFLLVIVVPEVLLLAVNVLVLVMYLRKTKNKKVQLNELSAEEKEALRKQLLADLAKQEAPKEEKEEPIEEK